MISDEFDEISELDDSGLYSLGRSAAPGPS